MKRMRHAIMESRFQELYAKEAIAIASMDLEYPTDPL
jgi:hypothetical protein